MEYALIVAITLGGSALLGHLVRAEQQQHGRIHAQIGHGRQARQQHWVRSSPPPAPASRHGSARLDGIARRDAGGPYAPVGARTQKAEER